MKYLVINPDWTVPPTILAQDVLAGMRKGQNHDRQEAPGDPRSAGQRRRSGLDRLGQKRRQGTSATRCASRPVPTTRSDASSSSSRTSTSIFLHDTPSRELFAADQRTFSSGCIRVEHPLDLAAVLLEGQDNWTPATHSGSRRLRASSRPSSSRRRLPV